MTAAAATETTEAFDPSALLNALQKKLDLKNDAALARVLEVQPPVISKLRHGRLPLGATMLIRMHEVSDISIKELRGLMGDRRKHFRGAGEAQGN
jgi:plasmid maintenance system antidote protein VapI